MLTKKDLGNIDERVQKIIKDAFSDFYENILERHFEQSEREHREIKAELKEEIIKTREELGEYIKDHEKRIRKLETITAS